MRSVFILSILFSSLSLYGTGQIPDYLIINKDTLPIHSNPLEFYFEKTGSRALPAFNSCASTACWRGYVAYWELRNDSIFLKEISACYRLCEEPNKVDLEQLFGSKFQKQGVFADWISFEIINPFGKQIEYIHQGYDSIYEFERGFVFEKGILRETVVYDNSKSRKCIYTQKPDSLSKFFYVNINWENLPPLEGDKDKVVVQFEVNELGEIQNVEVIRGINEAFDKEALRVVRLLKEWDIFLKRGKPVMNRWYLPVSFRKEVYEERINREK